MSGQVVVLVIGGVFSRALGGSQHDFATAHSYHLLGDELSHLTAGGGRSKQGSTARLRSGGHRSGCKAHALSKRESFPRQSRTPSS